MNNLIEEILLAEGWPKFTNRSDDRGGPTKGGITLKTLSSWRGVDCTIEDVIDLKKEEAVEIYKQRYIIAPGFDKLKDNRLKRELVHATVMSGPFDPIKWLQRSVGAKEDGVLGPKTLASIDEYDVNAILLRFAVYRIIFYSRIVREDHEQAVNIVGWNKRALKSVLEISSLI